jgi:hypothetical protein
MQIRAPWTDEQVRNLREYQLSAHVHPFTCPNRGNGKHFKMTGDRDLGVLVPTLLGWRCPDCDHWQDWAHDFMLDGRALRIAQDGPDTIP